MGVLLPNSEPLHTGSLSQISFGACGLILFLLVISAAGICADTASGQGPDESGLVPGLPVIDSVEVNPENVFDLSHPQYSNFLFRLANKMHIVTRKSVIERELLLGVGDGYDTALVNESIRNLRRLLFLLKTDIRLKTGSRGERIMIVETSDKWTTTGGLSFHRTGGRNDLQIGLEESNFLGYGISMSHDYFILEDDRDYYQTEFGDDRVWGQDFSFHLFYSDSPRAGQVSAALGRPFYSLRQKWGGKLAYSDLNRRRDYYVEQILAAQERIMRDRLQVEYSLRLGPNSIKYHFTPGYEYLDLKTGGRNVYDPSANSLLPRAAKDSLVHYVELTFRVQQINYAVFERLNRFHKPEDVNLGLDARISVGRGYDPGFDRRIYRYFSWWPRYSLTFKSNLLIIGLLGEQWYVGNGLEHQRMDWYCGIYARYHKNHTLAFRMSLVSDRLREKSFTLYLDEDRGLRGFPAFSFNGENRLIVNFENRFFSDVEILSVGLGAVAFADIGNIWTRDEDPALENTKWSIGMGFRFGVSRSSQAEVVRVDFAYAPERNSWEISVGTGQYF